MAAAFDTNPRRAVAGALVVTAAALVATVPVRDTRLRRLLPTLEVAIAAVGVIAPPGDRTSLLPYLLAPAFAAGLLDGWIPAVNVASVGALVLLVGHVLAGNATPLQVFAGSASEWLLLALAVGLLAAWVRRLAAESPRSDVNRSYEAAYDLLSQLRTVSRQLSDGLDALSVAQALLQSLQEEVRFDKGAVFVRSDGGRLVALAVEGAASVDWDAGLDEANPLGRAFLTGRPAVGSGALSTGSTDARSYAVFPIHMGDRSLGVVALESTSSTPPARGQVVAAADQVGNAALRLETALLFGEVRSIAASEERRRLAREIHDGIAQELASLGYAIDDLAADAADADDSRVGDVLRTLRGEVTRMVGELRLSIFDLRSDVQVQVGLGSALSDYVRAVSSGAPFSVRLILDEAAGRLPITVEAELLHIAQEAITNARKHSSAEHLWVTCRVDPPFAHIRIEDDGRGMGQARLDSFGLEVMRERAERLGAVLTVGQRVPHGTFVDVRLGERRKRRRGPTVSTGVVEKGGDRGGRERASR